MAGLFPTPMQIYKIRHYNEFVGYMVFGRTPDSDNEGLSDANEIKIYGTYPDTPEGMVTIPEKGRENRIHRT